MKTCYNVSMNKHVVKVYIAIVFLVITLMGSFHHHDDLAQHDDCQLCVILAHSNYSDVPSDVVYLGEVRHILESIPPKYENLYAFIKITDLNSRAPPSILS